MQFFAQFHADHAPEPGFDALAPGVPKPCSEIMYWAVRSASATPVWVELHVPAVGITPVLQKNRFSWSCARPHLSHTDLAGSSPMLSVPVICWLLAKSPSLLGRR